MFRGNTYPDYKHQHWICTQYIRYMQLKKQFEHNDDTHNIKKKNFYWSEGSQSSLLHDTHAMSYTD